jgi:hypothetical protein
MSLEQNQSVVKNLAKEFRGKRKVLNCFDANVCKSDFQPTRPHETKYLPGDLFEFEVRFQCGEHKFCASANNEFVSLALRLEDVVCSPTFTLNRPDRVMLKKTPVKQMRQLSCQVYASDNSSAAGVSTWLNAPGNLECLQSFSLGENDSLHVYANQLRVYLHNPSQDKVVAMLPRLEQLASHLHLKSEGVVDFNTLPEQFRQLKPLMEKWAVSDDQERSILVDEASQQTLKKLVQAVSPHMEAINIFLDSFESRPLSDAAALLGTLAECATEAKLRLENSRVV